MASKRACNRNRSFFIGFCITTLVIIGLIIAIIALAVQLNDAKGCGVPPLPPSRSTGLLEYFQMVDGLSLRWSPHVNTQEELSEAVRGNYDIIETDLLRTTVNKYSVGTAIQINDWMKQIKDSGAGAKLNIDAYGDPVAALYLAEKYKITAPVVMSVPYPEDQGHPSNFAKFISALTEQDWNFPLIASVDLTASCCKEPIGIGTVEFLWEKLKDLDFPLNFEIQAEHWTSSWRDLQRLMDKSRDITITVSADEKTGHEALYELLLVRNDVDRDRVFYKINGTTLLKFKELASTAGSPLLYFNIQPRDAGKIIWSHNTDTWELLNKAVNGPTMMVEADLRLKDSTPIMAHDPGEDNNLTFVQWLNEIIKVDKGIKLDFKELQAVGPVLDIVTRQKQDIKGPIWANADIVKGPNGKDVTMIPNTFFDKIKAFPDITLSVGWTTGAKDPNVELNYTMEMAQEIYHICKNLPQPVTFPVRANLLRSSWSVFHWLLQQSRAYTLTVWTSPADDVRKEDMDFIQRQSEAARVYFDLPEQLRPSFE